MIYKRVSVEYIKIRDLFSKLGVENLENSSVTVPFPLGVNTPYGFKNIVTAFRTEKQKTITTYFKNNKTLKTSGNHLLKVNGGWKKVRDIRMSDVIETDTGTTSIKRQRVGKSEILYDISVEEVHCYYSNGIVSHNSWFLAKLGAEAMRQGKNVMHFTMELNEKYVGLRYDAIFTGTAFQDVRKNEATIRNEITQLKANGCGKLFIKYFPTKSASAATLKMHIDRLQLVTGVKIDMVIVDYADLLRPFSIEKNSNTYNQAGDVYTELRGMLGELQVPGWSASQSNRGAHEEEIIQALDVADSYQKIMIGDFIMSLSRKMQDKLAGTGRIYVMKNRFGSDGIMYPCSFDTSCGKINIFDPKSIEGMEVLNKAKSAQESIKDVLKKAWNKTHNDDDSD